MTIVDEDHAHLYCITILGVWHRFFWNGVFGWEWKKLKALPTIIDRQKMLDTKRPTLSI